MSSRGFTEDDFPDDHESEMLITVGPIVGNTHENN